MNSKGKIKVIKKDAVKAPVEAKAPSKRAAAHTMVTNVTEWVSEFQVRKSRETKMALDKFFSTQPQPSGL